MSGPILRKWGWTFTPHALQRLHEMGLGAQDALDVLTNPEITYPSPETKYGPGRKVVVGGELAVVIYDDDKSVITVLWRGQESRDAI